MVHVRVREIKGNKYLYLYASERIGNRPRSRFIAYLGRAGTNAAKRLPKKYRSRELAERVGKLEFNARLDEIMRERHDMLVRLG